MKEPDQQQNQLVEGRKAIQSTLSYQNQTTTRFVYNCVPSNKLNHITQVPLAVHYTPFDEETQIEHRIKNMQGLSCEHCGAIINKYCKIMPQRKSWICCICNMNNMLKKYEQLSKNILAEESKNTFQIQLISSPISRDPPQKNQSIYLFLVDLCVTQKELQHIKQAILSFIRHNQKSMKKQEYVNTRIGIITYSKFVYFYELGSKINSVISIGCKKNYEAWDLAQILGLPKEQASMTHTQQIIGARFNQIRKKFLTLITQQEVKLQSTIKRIQKIKAEGDVLNENTLKRSRPFRAFGQALNIALCLAQLIPYETRIINFLSGPCTHGVGKIIGQDFKQHLRSLNDVDKGDQMTQGLKYYEKAKTFYSSLKQKAINRGVIIDIFSFGLQESGISEMYELIRVSGGYLVIGQQFSGKNKVFRRSFQKAYINIENRPEEENKSFEKNQSGEQQINESQSQQNTQYNSYGLNQITGRSAIVSILCSRDITVNGALGQCHPLQNFEPAQSPKKTHQLISERVVGFGSTNAWYLGVVDLYRTLTFVMDLANSKANEKFLHLQFKTFYTDCYGRKVVRITTARRQFQTASSKVVEGFDQEAAALTLIKLFIHKQLYDIKRNHKQWLDRILVKWTQSYGSYIKGDPQSFSLPPTMKFLPQYVYNFRKNPVFRHAGISLDELYYHIYCLNHYTIGRCITIIQPALLSYSVQNLDEPVPVKLDQEEMKENVLLLLDTYFNVVLWEGESVTAWKQQEYHKKEEYQHIKRLLEAPQEDIRYLLQNRFPYPGFYRTGPNDSKQRFLKSKVSATKSRSNELGGGILQQNQNMLTDDVGLQGFMQALIDIIVNQKIK